MKGTTRNGFHGTITEELGNGFLAFVADNGVSFTIHGTEFLPDDASAGAKRETEKRWDSWPVGDISISVERRTANSAPALVVRSLMAASTRTQA